MAMARKRTPKGKRIPLNMRTTKELRDRVEAAARASGRSLVQEVEYRVERSFEWEETAAALDGHAVISEIVHTYRPLGDLGLPPLWSPEYERIRHEGGHPALPPDIERALRAAARRAKVTPEEYWKARLRELGHDPDAPYQAPAEASEPDQPSPADRPRRAG
jgi:hypothetical protein